MKAKLKSDIQIEQSVEKWPIGRVAGTLGLTEDEILPHGRYIAKIPTEVLKARTGSPDGHLVLVTAMTPTPMGEGKTTTTIGLGDALVRLGKRASISIREPSLGPYFGRKGGGTGSGHAQVIPAEDINLHFTGDIPGVAKANNLLAAMIDNHLHHSNALDIDQRRITWRRVVDINDRALRDIVIGLGGPDSGIPRKDGFHITPASEIMAILCLADDFVDLRERMRRIVIGYSRKLVPVTCAQLKADAAMAVLLRDAIHPNFVQTLGHTPAFIHGGPFGNIAHGCSSAVATRTALKLCEYVVTEAGFGSDLGAEKFFDIKCRVAGLRPSVAVIVATSRAIEYHGGFEPEGGLDNLRHHIQNVRQFGVPVVVAINRFTGDKPEVLRGIVRACEGEGVRAVVSNVWAEGGEGGEELAQAVIEAAEGDAGDFRFLYDTKGSIREKVETIARRSYGAGRVHFERAALEVIDLLEERGWGGLPVCMAKTHMSLSDNPKLRGAPREFDLTVSQVSLAAGAGFVVAIAGSIMTMPGLPKVPAAERIQVDSQGRLTGMA